jgi:GDP-L-fucose synthase
MKILILGGSGMLGSAIRQELNKLEIEFVAPTSIELDLRNTESVIEYFRQSIPTVVFHCAAIVGGIGANIRRNIEFFDSNYEIDNNVIEACEKFSISRLIYFGSSCMYPANRNLELTEKDLLTGPIEKTNEWYGLAKIIATKKVEFYADSKNLNWNVFVLSNMYGPNDNYSEENSHLIPAVIRKIHLAKKEGKSEIEIWGSGKSRREFTYVEDVANWVVSTVIEKDTNLPTLLNLGIGTDYTVNDYYQFVAEILNVNAEFTHNLNMPDGNSRKLMDSGLARKYGWNPQTHILVGLEKTIDWYQGFNND